MKLNIFQSNNKGIVRSLEDTVYQLYSRCEVNDSDFRCSVCKNMKTQGSKLIWITDGTLIGDLLETVRRREMGSMYNGHSSGWCEDCFWQLVKKGGAMPVEVRPPAPVVTPRPPRPNDPLNCYTFNEANDDWEIDVEQTESRKQHREAEEKYQAKRRELRAAISTRVLTEKEIVLVGREGSRIFVDIGRSYKQSEVDARFTNAMLVQSCLQIASSRVQKTEGEESVSVSLPN